MYDETADVAMPRGDIKVCCTWRGLVVTLSPALVLMEAPGVLMEAPGVMMEAPGVQHSSTAVATVSAAGIGDGVGATVVAANESVERDSGGAKVFRRGGSPQRVAKLTIGVATGRPPRIKALAELLPLPPFRCESGLGLHSICVDRRRPVPVPAGICCVGLNMFSL